MPPTFVQLFNQHLSNLKEHLTIWASVQDQEIPGSRSHVVAQGCIDRTQEMIKHFEVLPAHLARADSTQPNDPASDLPKKAKDQRKIKSYSANGQTEELSLRPSKRRRREEDLDGPAKPDSTIPTLDTSGLFTVDTNPTPVEDLLPRASNKDADRPSKRSKTAKSQENVRPMGLSEEDLTQNPTDLPQSKTATAGVPHDAPGDAENDSFMAKVNKRHHEKEEKRKKKSDKKRKRESNTSVEAQASEEQTKTEKRKEKKQKHEEGEELTKVSGKSSKSTKLKRTKSSTSSGFKDRRQKG